MATGLQIQLTRQIGEHLVTAELGRRGIVATPFAGNVPDFDLLASANGKTVEIQVKAIQKDSWQFDARKFLDIDTTKSGQQIKGKNKELNRKIIGVFVALGNELGKDEFYIFSMGWLQDYFIKTYTGRKPPKNIKSYHCAIWKKDMIRHLGKWNLLKKKFGICLDKDISTNKREFDESVWENNKGWAP